MQGVLGALVVAGTLLASGEASAQLRVVEGAPGGVAEMSVAKGGLEALVRVKNEGPKPLPLRVRTLSAIDDVRLPNGVSVTLDGHGEQMTLGPGDTAAARVRWQPSQSPRMREVYGHIVFESAAGAVPVGIHAELSGALAPRALSLLVLAPLLGALAAWLLGRSGGLARARVGALSGAGAQLALAVWLGAFFERSVGRIDGNEGLQFIERAGLGPIEWFVGLDGGSSVTVAVVAASGLVAAWTSASAGTLALGSLAASALALAAVAQDIALLWIALAVGLGAAVASAIVSGASRRLVVLPAATLALAGTALMGLSRAVSSPLRLDVAPASRGLAWPDLVRVDPLAHSLLGQPLAASALVLTVAALAPWLPVWPLGDAARAVRERGGAVAAALPAVASLLLVRIASLLVPEGLAWAGPGLAWFGAAMALVAGLAALGSPSRVTGSLLAAQAGLGLVGLAAGTPIGLAGALTAGLGASLGWLLASWPGARHPWTTRVGLLALGAAPGLVGFWGPAFALTGAVPLRTAAALVATAGWALALWAAVRARPVEAPASNEAPGAREGRLALAAAVLVLGLAPGLLSGALERWSLDLGSFVAGPGPSQVARADLGVPGARARRVWCPAMNLRSRLATLMAVVALASPLLVTSPVFAYGSVSPTKSELEDNGTGWKLNITIKLGKKPATAHQPMRFVFTPQVLYETFLDDTKPGEQTRNIPQGKDVEPLIENLDVSFGDVQGNLWETTKFDFPLKRERGFQAGEYSVAIQDTDGKAVGSAFKIKLAGKNTVIDRRAMVFAGGGPKKKPEEKKPDAPPADNAAAAPAETPAPATTTPPGVGQVAAEPPPEVKPKQGGCGCQLPGGESTPAGSAVLAAFAVATGTLAARSRRSSRR